VADPIKLTAGPLTDGVADLLDDAAAGPNTAPPGALVAILDRERIRYAAGGFAQHLQREPPVEITLGTRTDAGSITKIIGTTAALMTLVDAGELDLDRPAAGYLPILASHRSTVRDLLEHQAGLWEWWPLYLSGIQHADAVALAARLPLRYRPRTGRHYSDLGFILLGEVVTRVTGLDLTSAVNELVLTRFGLTETRYAEPVPGAPVAASSTGDRIEKHMISSGDPYPVDGDVAAFDRWRTHVLIGEVNDGNSFHAFGGVAGHAGVFTTADDLLHFAIGLRHSLDGAGPLRSETVAAFLTPGDDPTQALGFRIWDGPSGHAVGHTGFPGVAFALLPERNAAVTMITNRLHTNGPPRPLEDMWLRALTAAQLQLKESSPWT
jgi:CubicO group peptidase (beta-lactamase class C family)